MPNEGAIKTATGCYAPSKLYSSSTLLDERRRLAKISHRLQERLSGDVLTAEEAAASLKVSRKTVIRLLERGEIKGKKVGVQWRLRRFNLDAYLDGDEGKEENVR